MITNDEILCTLDNQAPQHSETYIKVNRNRLHIEQKIDLVYKEQKKV